MKELFKEIKKDKMLLSNLLAGIPYMYSKTCVSQYMYQNLQDRLMTFMSLLAAVVLVYFTIKWRDKDGQEITKKIFKPMLIVETTSYGLLVGYFLLSKNVIAFYVLNCLMNIIISQNILNCLYFIEAVRYGEEKIAKYNMDKTAVGSINSIIGYGLSTLLPPSVNAAFIIFYIATVIDNYYQIKVYNDTFKKM